MKRNYIQGLLRLKIENLVVYQLFASFSFRIKIYGKKDKHPISNINSLSKLLVLIK